MARIELNNNLPGIASLIAYRPQTGAKMQALAQQLMRGESDLTSAERELIAACVSAGNGCRFCASAHGATARVLLDGDSGGVVEEVLHGRSCPQLDERMNALLAIADKVRDDPLTVTQQDVDMARAAGASDQAIHDAVAVAAAFCMYNRYVDALATATPTDESAYASVGQMLATVGYPESVSG